MKEKIAIAVERVNRALKGFGPVASIGLFSGGHDSLSACFIASKSDYFAAMGHCNTGIGIEATREFVRETCRIMNWPLIEATGQNYEETVLKYGFPGPSQHMRMYIKLKERALRKIKRCFVLPFSGRRIAYIQRLSLRRK